MNLTKIKEIFSGNSKQSNVKIGGWVRAFRGNKFIELNDGSSLKNIQCVINPETTDCLLYTSPSPRDRQKSRMPSSA